MFGFNTLRSRMNGKRMGMLAAPVMMAAAAAPMMGMGDLHAWFRFGDRHDHDRGTVVVTTRPRVVVQEPVIVCEDVIPSGLAINAYEAHGTIFMQVRGSNRSGGYATSLAALDTRCASPTLVLRNAAPRGICTQAITPICLNAAFRAEGKVGSVDVMVAGKRMCIPVECVASL